MNRVPPQTGLYIFSVACAGAACLLLQLGAYRFVVRFPQIVDTTLAIGMWALLGLALCGAYKCPRARFLVLMLVLTFVVLGILGPGLFPSRVFVSR